MAAEEQTDMLLAVGELATNAIMHAGTGFNVVCTVNGVVTIEVEDGNPQELPSLRAPQTTEAGGFGLRIVERIAREWTVEVRDHTKLVRAVFDRPSFPAPSETAARGHGRSFGPEVRRRRLMWEGPVDMPRFIVSSKLSDRGTRAVVAGRR